MVGSLLYAPLRLQMWHGRCFCEAVGYCLRRQCPLAPSAAVRLAA